MLVWLLCAGHSAFANESFVAGLYTDNKGNNYIVSGPAASQTNRSQWSIVSLGNRVSFSAIWETGAATGNAYVGNESGIRSNASKFPAGVSYGLSGENSLYWGTGGLISANQTGNVLTLSEVNSDGSLGYYSLALSRLSDSAVATSSASSVSFATGIYADTAGQQYLVSGPATSQAGRQQWTITSIAANNQFSALWETGTAIGNTYIGNSSSLTSYPNGYPAGRAYGITGATSWYWGTGRTLAASQTGNVLTLTILNSDGTPNDSVALITVGVTDAATSSASSESFVAGSYTDFSGTPYIVSGPAPSQAGRAQWTVTSLDPNKAFAALWETGSAIGNTYIGNTYGPTNYANGYPTGRSYGATGNNVWYWGTGNTLAASQTGNVLTLTRLNSDGTPTGSSATLIRTGGNSLATASPTSESFAAGTYTAQDGTVYQVQNSGNSWSITSPVLAPYQFSANWQTGSVASNPLVSSNYYVKTYPAGYPSGRSYGVVGTNSFYWYTGYIFSASQTGNLLTLTLLNGDGTPSGNSMTLLSGGYAGTWNFASAGQVQFRDSAISVSKNESTAKVYVTRVGGAKGAVGVGWLSVDGTALSGVDYTGGSGSLSWADGDVSTKTIAIKLLANNFPAGKSFSIQLNNPAVATIGTPSTVTVTTQAVNYTSKSDRWFDWAENNYPGIFSTHQSSQIFSGSYYYRCYPAACIASGLGGDIDSLYYLNESSGALSKLGSVSTFLNQVTQTPPSPNDCLFNWAESNYPSLFAPASTTVISGIYTYRYYSATKDYLGVSSADNHVYYLGSNGVLQDEGPTSYWFPQAGCL